MVVGFKLKCILSCIIQTKTILEEEYFPEIIPFVENYNKIQVQYQQKNTILSLIKFVQ